MEACPRCGDRITTRIAVAFLLALTLFTRTAQSGSIQKRDVGDDEAGDIHTLISAIGGRQKVDLILGLDRSQGMSKETFYLSGKKLMQSLLKQYASLDSDYVRLAMISFAEDVSVDMDYITNPDGMPNKCSMFNGENNIWDSKLSYTHDLDKIKGTNIRGALLKAREIFNNGEKHRSNTAKYILIATDGKYDKKYDPITVAKELKSTLNTTIYAIGLGTWREIGNVRVFTSKPNGRHLYAEFDDWQRMLQSMSTLTSFESDTPAEWLYMYKCQISCMENSRCYCDLDRGTEVCLCNAGYEYNNTGNGSCQACPVDTFKDMMGNNDTCTPCPPGSIIETTASTVNNCKCNESSCDDPCATKTCNANQECRAVNSTQANCVCKDGWEGIACDINTDECKDNNQCQHSGKCMDGLGTGVFTCVCSNWGYTGQFCEINQIECTDDMCVNNGNCTDRINNFLCVCPDGWKGRYCQDVLTTSTSTTTTTTTTTTTPATPTSGGSTEDDDNTLWIIIGAAAGGGLLLIIIIVVVACCVCKKRQTKNKEEVKNIAHQFSGFWKRRTVRGSKYVKEMEEDANGGLPSAPYAHRPDLIENTDGPYMEDFKTDEYAELPQQTMTLKTGMESWQNYITELEEAKTVESALITKLSGDKKAVTGGWMFDFEEVQNLEKVMDQKDNQIPLLLQDGEYHLMENDGTLAVGRTFGDSLEAKTLTIGKTRTYLIVTIAKGADDNGKSRKEVQWVVDHINGEGY